MPVPYSITNAVAVHRSTIEAPRERFQRMVRGLESCPDVSTQSFQAAVLLVCAREVGQNVDKLAAITGFAREFVARCARRLHDNGVWLDGETIGSWLNASDDEFAFWADAAVAEGKLCRRRDQDGKLSWAPAGVWWKSFDYRDTSTAAKAWLDVPEPELESELTMSGAFAPATGQLAEGGVLEAVALAAASRPGSARATTAAEHSAGTPRRAVFLNPPEVAFATAADLFPDAVWLK